MVPGAGRRGSILTLGSYVQIESRCRFLPMWSGFHQRGDATSFFRPLSLKSCHDPAATGETEESECTAWGHEGKAVGLIEAFSKASAQPRGQSMFIGSGRPRGLDRNAPRSPRA